VYTGEASPLLLHPCKFIVHDRLPACLPACQLVRSAKKGKRRTSDQQAAPGRRCASCARISEEFFKST